MIQPLSGYLAGVVDHRRNLCWQYLQTEIGVEMTIGICGLNQQHPAGRAV